MSLEPFAPPQEKDAESDGLSGLIVAVSWMVAGAALGTAIGAWAQIFGFLSGVDAVPVGIGMGLGFGAIGFASFKMERRAARARPQLVDGRGRLVRPLAAWLFAIPMGVAVFGFLGLTLLATLRSVSPVPALVFLVGFGGMLGILRPLLGRRALTLAVEALEDSRVPEARTRLENIDRAGWWPQNVRTMAALNLGLLCLEEGSLDEAAAWYDRAGAEKGRGLAATGLALVRTLQDRYPEAQALLARASSQPDARGAQAEIDAVRLLLTLRRDGAEEARALGNRLAGPGAGSLFLAVLAAARAKSGDEAGARELITEPSVAETLESGFGRVIPELAEMRWM